MQLQLIQRHSAVLFEHISWDKEYSSSASHLPVLKVCLHQQTEQSLDRTAVIQPGDKYTVNQTCIMWSRLADNKRNVTLQSKHRPNNTFANCNMTCGRCAARCSKGLLKTPSRIFPYQHPEDITVTEFFFFFFYENRYDLLVNIKKEIQGVIQYPKFFRW